MRIFMCWYFGAKALRNIEETQAIKGTLITGIQHTFDSKERERKGKSNYKL